MSISKSDWMTHGQKNLESRLCLIKCFKGEPVCYFILSPTQSEKKMIGFRIRNLLFSDSFRQKLGSRVCVQSNWLQRFYGNIVTENDSPTIQSYAGIFILDAHNSFSNNSMDTLFLKKDTLHYSPFCQNPMLDFSFYSNLFGEERPVMVDENDQLELVIEFYFQ